MTTNSKPSPNVPVNLIITGAPPQSFVLSMSDADKTIVMERRGAILFCLKEPDFKNGWRFNPIGPNPLPAPWKTYNNGFCTQAKALPPTFRSPWVVSDNHFWNGRQLVVPDKWTDPGEWSYTIMVHCQGVGYIAFDPTIKNQHE